MSIEIHQFPCLEDNYGFLVRDTESGQCVCVDTPDSEKILRQSENLGWKIDYIFNTHWHPDHIDGNAHIKSETGAKIFAPEEVSKRVEVDCVVFDRSSIMIGSTEVIVIGTPGHTHGHVAYYAANEAVVFVGDTLFPMGCGRVFEGSPAQMWNSLRKLAELPHETRVYSAHEYTESNCHFALTVDSSGAVRDRCDEVFNTRARGGQTVPTTIGAEIIANPFLKLPMQHGCIDGQTSAFAEVRQAKDNHRPS